VHYVVPGLPGKPSAKLSRVRSSLVRMELVVMSELNALSPDEWERLVNQVRMHNTAKLREVLAILEPWVDGSAGAVSPPHVKLYLQALKDLGVMYKVHEPPKAVEVGEDPRVALVRLEAQQSRVLEQLEVLEAKAKQRRLGA